MGMPKSLAYGTYGTLFGIGHAKQKLDKNPDAKEVVKQAATSGKSLLKAIPKKIIQMSNRAKEWS